MRIILSHIIILLAVMCSLHCAADDTAPKDTVYFYDTWQQMLDNDPVEELINPEINCYSNYEIYVISSNERTNLRIQKQHIALSLGDSIWLINSNFINRYFHTDEDEFMGYIPVFFNEKLAYLTYHASMSTKDLLFGLSVGDNGEILYDVDYFYLDFANRKVNRVTPKYLSELLEEYHDLQMRYEGMKDYKKKPIIEEFFLKYIDRATNDFLHPYIIDLLK